MPTATKHTIATRAAVLAHLLPKRLKRLRVDADWLRELRNNPTCPHLAPRAARIEDTYHAAVRGVDELRAELNALAAAAAVACPAIFKELRHLPECWAVDPARWDVDVLIGELRAIQAADLAATQTRPAATDWRTVQARLLSMRKRGTACPTIRALAAALGCSNATISKAINDSPKLRGWKARGRTSAPRAVGLSGSIIDATEQSTERSPDTELAELIAEQQADDRGRYYKRA